MYDEVVFAVDGEKATPVDRIGLADLDLQERAHLQEWILSNPSVIGPGAEVITSEFDKWQTSTGDPVLDRLDVLAIGPDGRLIVVELKRGAAPHTVHMQAINYAAMVSRLQPQDVADLYAARRTAAGFATSRESALTELQTQYLLTVDGIRRPRIVLVASDFPPSVTASVVWLNEQHVDISLVRFRAYQIGEQIAVSFSRLFPVPDVEEFTIGRRAEPEPSAGDDVGEAWDEASLRALFDQANATTLALLDLCSQVGAGPVYVSDVASAAHITEGQVRGQLAGLTMRLRNPKYGFKQKKWPVFVEWLSGGVATYGMESDLSALWRKIRAADGGTSASTGQAHL